MNSNKKNRPLIKSIGYMWHRKYVDWNHGQLLGFPERGSQRRPVDFANQAGIYVLYNPQFEPVYIGQAGSGNTGLFRRLGKHADEDYLFCLWERFTWFGFYKNNDFETAKGYKISTNVNKLMNTIEAMLIHTTRPKYNLSRGKLEGVKWYYQAAEFEEREKEYRSIK